MMFLRKCGSFTFWKLSSQDCELLWVLQELHHLLQLILSLLYAFDVVECDVFHLHGVHCRVQA